MSSHVEGLELKQKTPRHKAAEFKSPDLGLDTLSGTYLEPSDVIVSVLCVFLRPIGPSTQGNRVILAHLVQYI